MLIRESFIEDAPAIAKVTVDTWRTAYGWLDIRERS